MRSFLVQPTKFCGKMVSSGPRTRVFVADTSNCPDDAIVRSQDGRSYYYPNGRVSRKEVGGSKQNELREELDKADADERLTVEEVSELCQACAEKMRERGIRELKVKAIDDLLFKPFSGPEGQGPFDSFDDCVDSMGDEEGIDNPEGWCAWAEEQDKSVNSDMAETEEKIYVGSEEQVPEGIEVKEDEAGRKYYPKSHTSQQARAVYSEETEEEIEDETDVEMPDSEDAGDGTPGEEEFEDQLEDLRDSIADVEDEDGLIAPEMDDT